MKVGILSMQRIVNYGSFLQAFGLKKTIESLGHEVVFVDYKSEPPLVPYSRKSYLANVARQSAAVAYIEDFIRKRGSFEYAYHRQYLPLLGVSYRRNPAEKTDMAVIGSDEVFNCLQSGPNVGFAPMLFGQGVNARKVISYAASCGYTDLDGIRRHGLEDRLGGYLRSFAALSARDENTRRVISALTEREPVMNLDPVLISDFDLPGREPLLSEYVVLYTYRVRPYAREEAESIQAFCRKNGKTLVSLGEGQPWVDQIIPADPFEMLRYIQRADFVITDTFHGAIFSIKYNKKFAVLVRPDNRQKLEDLLTRLNMGDRQIGDFSELQGKFESEPDFARTNEIIAAGRRDTLSYLEKNLRL